MDQPADAAPPVAAAGADAIVVLGGDGTIRYASPSTARVLGYAPAALVGRPALAVVPEPERTRVAAVLADLLARPGATVAGEHAYRHPDGTRRWLASSATNLLAEPTVAALVATCRDVTARRQAEEAHRFLAEASAALAASLDYQATLGRAAQLAVPHLADWCTVHAVDDDGSIVQLAVERADPATVARVAALRDLDPGDPAAPPGVPRVLRTGRAELYPEAPAALLEAVVPDAARRAALAAAGGCSAMVVPLRARGRVLGAVSFVAAESGRRYGDADLALAHDLAERAALAVDNARLYRQAQAAIAARERFFLVAAHELRSPVTTIRGFAQLLARELPAGQAARYAGRIVEASTRLVALTEDLRDVSAIQLGQLPLRPVPFDLAPFVREVARRVQEQRGAGHRVRAVVECDPCPVVADRDRLEQVLNNLIDNAIRYGPAGGEVVLTLRPEGEGVLLAVQDEGRGLPPGATEARFAPFERVGAATEASLPGLGLGLAICRGIVERHGGRIWAEGPGPAGGTIVRVWLPDRVEDPGGGPPVG